MKPSRKSAVMRKLPVQERSVATIATLHVAVIQVLTRDGLGGCTTTRIAQRAGVSVGTIYQYFPNRDVLLATVLERHLKGFSESLIGACKEVEGKPIAAMIRHLVATLLRLKMSDRQEAAVLYTVAAEKIGKNIALTVHKLLLPVIARMLQSAPDVLFERLNLTAEVFLSIFLGLPRTLLEDYGSEEFAERLGDQLELALLSYLQAMSSAPRRAPDSRSARSICKDEPPSVERSLGAAIENCILVLLRARDPAASICPSDAARAVGDARQEDWRNLMAPTRAIAVRMALAGRLHITRRGKILDPANLGRGAIRLRLRAFNKK